MLFILVGTSLLSFAGCSLVLLSFFSQSAYISVQLWAIFHWTSSTRDRTIWALILRDICKLPVVLENSSFEIFFGQKIFQILRKQLLQKTPTSLISISIHILHPLLLSSTHSQTAGQPWHYCWVLHQSMSSNGQLSSHISHWLWHFMWLLVHQAVP